ncbi:Levanase [bioreactor metagenome]|uniref:beta-fructofuranosidase n=1 Tax=bioreactor metagenome TaxID=1076179 RepID=A0A644ZNX8_9ZZZZ
MSEVNHWIPVWHFWAPESRHYPFDPNGCIFWNGRYHVFYLFQDKSVASGDCCWGHASSADLINWDFHPAALICDMPGEKAMFSGCALLDRAGRPTLVYHSVGQGTCVAFPEDDNLIRWRKSEHNPVIREPKEQDPEFAVYHVFDPHVWLEKDCYYAILGARAKPYVEYDTAYLFRSHDLTHWKYCRPFYQATDHFCARYDDCACPDFFRIGDSWVLLCISHTRGARYYVGDYIEHTFVPRSHHWLNFPGGNMFAPETLCDAAGRRIAWFWLLPRFPQKQSVLSMPQIWSLPHELKMAEDGSALLHFVPKEFACLCETPFAPLEHFPVAGERVLFPYRSQSCKIEVDVTILAGSVTFEVLADAEGKEALLLRLDAEQNLLSLDHSRAGVSQSRSPYFVNLGAPEKEEDLCQKVPWYGDKDGRFRFDIYLDHCVVELFSSDGRCTATQLVYNYSECNRIACQVAPEAKVCFHSLKVCPMKAANRTAPRPESWTTCIGVKRPVN